MKPPRARRPNVQKSSKARAKADADARAEQAARWDAVLRGVGTPEARR